MFVEGGIYHVYNRFARGAELFADPEEAIEFLEILRKAGDRGVRGHGSDGAPGICPGAEGRAAGGVARRTAAVDSNGGVMRLTVRSHPWRPLRGWTSWDGARASIGRG